MGKTITFLLTTTLVLVLRSNASLSSLAGSGAGGGAANECAKSSCDYAKMMPLVLAGQTPYLPAVNWRTSEVTRSCSCTAYCALYGDCCVDSLALSRQNLQDMLNKDWHDVQQLRSALKPVCRELEIGIQDESGKQSSFINVQKAAECDDCYVDDITTYFGSNASEISDRLPVYYEGLGIVFSNLKCARCYENKLDMSKVKPIPLVAKCNSSVNILNGTASEADDVYCHYSLNISQLMEKSAKLAVCLPTVDDIYMQEAFVCSGLNMTDRLFKPCDHDHTATKMLTYDVQAGAGSIYRMCSVEDSDVLAQCSQDAGDEAAQSILKSVKPNWRCVRAGDIVPQAHVRALSDAQSFIHRMQRSDFSYRYMFDIFKLAAAEEAIQHRGASACSGGRREIFIERWRICVRRNAGDITIGIEPFYYAWFFNYQTTNTYQQLPSGDETTPSFTPINDEETEWLDFSSSFFLLRQEENINGTVLAVLKREDEPDFKLESKCFRFNFVTERFHVSHKCLCEIFRQSAQSISSSLTQSIIPRSDDILSLVGSVSVWISLACLIIVIIVLSAIPKLRNRPTKLVMILSIFLCIGMTMVLVNIYANVSIVRPRHQQEPTYEENCLRSPKWKEVTCNLIGASLHFSYLATFCLASALYIDLWYSVQKSCIPGYHESAKRFWLLAGTSLAIPLVIVLTAVVIDKASPDNDFAPRYAEFVCWISEPNALFVFFVCPVVLALIVDIVFFILIARQIRANSFKPVNFTNETNQPAVKMDEATKKKRREEKRQSYLRRLGIYAKMALMMGLTWLLGCVAPFIPDGFVSGVVLWYGFVVLNGLQGVFIFYTYILNKKTLQTIRETIRKARNSSASGTNNSDRTRANQNAPNNRNVKQHEAARKCQSDSKLLERN